MTRDGSYALMMMALFGIVVSQQSALQSLVSSLLMISRPAATVALLLILAFVYSRGFVYTTLSLALVVVYLLQAMWIQWAATDDYRLSLDVGKDQARFNPSTSVDLQWASRAVTHDSPNMLHKDHDASPLLLFPPSADTLASLSG